MSIIVRLWNGALALFFVSVAGLAYSQHDQTAIFMYSIVSFCQLLVIIVLFMEQEANLDF